MKIVESDYVWWNFDTELTVHVPAEMGGGPAWNSMSEPPKESRAKSRDASGKSNSNQKVMITRTRIYLFTLTNRLEL